ncbi:ferrochelatase [Thiohalorhabdus sp.]|uniref:ferrochelatase n=1 Tax=Thiohalorhabdus sp. TaxID=3094134 RepID=UPI002FC34EB6
MARFKGEPDYRHGSTECTGVLLVNLGSPEAPTKPALRRYLAEFLWDPRVVEVPRPVWWAILHGIILRTRPAKSAASYRDVWDQMGEGAPLIAVSRKQQEGIEHRLQERFDGPVTTALAMRYGTPSIAEGLAELNRAGARRILVLPLYPQYSGSTSASVFDAVTDELRTWRWVPEVRMVQHYHREPDYIAALAKSIREHWTEHGRPDKLVMSFHGVPKRYLLAGDPYHCQCQATGRLLAQELGLADDEWRLTFQSRFGRAEWLQPYTDQTLKALPREGAKTVHVVCPGFSADCLETLQEIDDENREYFLEAGGETFRYIPALNDRSDHLDFLADLAAGHCQGWPEHTGWDPEADVTERQASRERALAMGAAQ